MLEFAEEHSMSHIVSWDEDGKSFTVRNTAAFVQEILPYFCKSTNDNLFQLSFFH